MFVASYLQDIKSLPYLLGAWLIYVPRQQPSQVELSIHPETLAGHKTLENNCTKAVGLCTLLLLYHLLLCRSVSQAFERMITAAARSLN